MKRTQSTYDEHLESLTLNERIGMWITRRVGTMWCAYAFAAIALVALPAALASGDPVIIVAWVSQAFLQLVLLPMIMVGQNVLSRHTEIQTEADFRTNIEAEHRIEKLQLHLARIETDKLDHILKLLTTKKPVLFEKRKTVQNG